MDSHTNRRPIALGGPPRRQTMTRTVDRLFTGAEEV